MSFPITTRSEAARNGNTKYYTGNPCKRGHLARRYTITAACTMCVSQKRRSVRQDIERAQELGKLGYLVPNIQIHESDVPLLKDIVKIINGWRANPESDTKLAMLGAYVQALNFE